MNSYSLFLDKGMLCILGQNFEDYHKNNDKNI